MNNTNPGPVGVRGGKRKGAGKRSNATKALLALAGAEGKSSAEILIEAQAGYDRAMRLVSVAMPEILTSLLTQALRGDREMCKFVVSLYFRHGVQTARPPDDNPISKLRASLNLVIERAMASGNLTPIPTVEGHGYTVVDDTTKPASMGDTTRP